MFHQSRTRRPFHRTNCVGYEILEARQVLSTGEVVNLSLDDGTYGYEPWQTDGTVAGTRMIVDVNPGTADGGGAILARASTKTGDFGFFIGADGQLWRTDGTTAGTLRLTDIKVNAFGDIRSGDLAPGYLVTVGDEVWFSGALSTTIGGSSAFRAAWKTDGTVAGTVAYATLDYDLDINRNAFDKDSYAIVGGTLWVAGRKSVLRTDGTEAGTVEHPGILQVPALALTDSNRLFYQVSDGSVFEIVGDTPTLFHKMPLPSISQPVGYFNGLRTYKGGIHAVFFLTPASSTGSGSTVISVENVLDKPTTFTIRSFDNGVFADNGYFRMIFGSRRPFFKVAWSSFTSDSVQGYAELAVPERADIRILGIAGGRAILNDLVAGEPVTGAATVLKAAPGVCEVYARIMSQPLPYSYSRTTTPVVKKLGDKLFILLASKLESALIVTDGTVAGTSVLGSFQSEYIRLYRAYNPVADYHFFTTSRLEFLNAISHGYIDESTGRGGFAVVRSQAAAFSADYTSIGNDPIYRLYNLSTGRHYYTTKSVERDYLVGLIPPGHPEFGRVGWRFEKIEGYDSFAPERQQLFRLYNNNSGVHLYTENATTKDAVLAAFPGVWVEHDPLGFAIKLPDPLATSPPASASASSTREHSAVPGPQPSSVSPDGLDVVLSLLLASPLSTPRPSVPVLDDSHVVQPVPGLRRVSAAREAGPSDESLDDLYRRVMDIHLLEI
jgi:ELWxxDGT repeat protein